MSNKPSIPKGTRDFSPIEMVRRNYIFDTIKKSFKKYGFQQIETPAMENLNTLVGTGGDESDKLIFKILDSGDFLKKPLEKKIIKENTLAYINLHIYFSLRFCLNELMNSEGNIQNDLKKIDRTIDEELPFHMYTYQNVDLLAITTEFFRTHYNYFKEIALKINDRDDPFDFCFNQFYNAHFLQNSLHSDFIEMVANAIDKNKVSIENISASEFSNYISEKALHYDLTVPFARYVVQNQNDITFPFRRFQIQPVWRADRPQKGRYREFYQCDADIIGSDSLLNEVDLIKMIDDVFTELFSKDGELKLNYTVSINNRKILQGIVEAIGEQDKFEQIVVAIDKFDKVGFQGVIEEFKKLEIPQEKISVLSDVLLNEDLHGSGLYNNLNDYYEPLINQLNDLLNKLKGNSIGQKGIEELEFVFEKLRDLGIKTANIKFDPTLARGLGYYTGTIIEVKVDNFPSITGGGRYDDLTGKFGLKNVSGVGISFGADRIYDVLLDNNLYPEFKGDSTQVLFTNQSAADETRFLSMLFQLRDKGINAELYTEQAKWQKQMIFAEKKGIKFIVSTNEKGETFVKEMDGAEKKPFLSVEELMEIIKK